MLTKVMVSTRCIHNAHSENKYTKHSSNTLLRLIYLFSGWTLCGFMPNMHKKIVEWYLIFAFRIFISFEILFSKNFYWTKFQMIWIYEMRILDTIQQFFCACWAWNHITSNPKISISSAVVYYYCVWYTYFQNGHYVCI